ncbi:MAG: prolipoprotein diacylglyceryl transferase [Bacilli bacterium]|nr:prolipoprotein diacylglyceryl transferase [Bacilli bacterium]
MNNIFLDLGPIKIYWYSILLLIAFFTAGALAFKEAKKFNISEAFMTNYFFYLVPIVIIGARLYFVLFNLDYYKMYPTDIFKTWEGGLAIHGGVIAGIIFTYFYTKKYKISFFRMTDIGAVSLIFGQALGRWGNFMNGEAFGPVTTLSALQKQPIPNFVIEGMNIGGIYHLPTFYYESVWCLIGFVLLLLLRRMKSLKISNLTSFYLVWYGLGRFWIEGLRTDSLMMGNLRIAQLVSLLSILIGIALFVHSKKSSPKNNLYNQKEA